MLDEIGEIHNTIEDKVLALAREHGMEVVPLLANEKPEAAHNLLANPDLRRRVIDNVLRLCQAAGCSGLQLDIEGVGPQDGAAFTELVRETAQTFHSHHLQLSVALPTPLLTPKPGEQYAETFGEFVVYREPYELAQIAPYVDFVSLMTYGQFGRGTPSGPVASYAWVEQSIRYALQFVPPEKLSMGLGLWAYRWCNEQVIYSGYAEVETLRNAHHATAHWDSARRSPSFEFEDEHHCRTTVWFENRRSLHEKIKLVKRYGLWGFSAWRLGQEDPEFWREMHRSSGKRQARSGGL
jgi:spore germination protein YaaH